MSKGQEWRKYEKARNRDKTLFIRCTQEERELVYKLAEKKNKTIIRLLLDLVEKELKEE